MNHTPGPWGTSKDAVPEGIVQVTVYAEATGDRVATAFDRKENARLIAAAPDLLEAAIAMRMIDHKSTRADVSKACDMLNDAITKATTF